MSTFTSVQESNATSVEELQKIAEHEERMRAIPTVPTNELRETKISEQLAVILGYITNPARTLLDQWPETSRRMEYIDGLRAEIKRRILSSTSSQRCDVIDEEELAIVSKHEKRLSEIPAMTPKDLHEKRFSEHHGVAMSFMIDNGKTLIEQWSETSRRIEYTRALWAEVRRRGLPTATVVNFV